VLSGCCSAINVIFYYINKQDLMSKDETYEN